MAVIDIGDILDAFVEFMTFFLIQIPQVFISATLDSGIIREIWVGIFGSPEIIQVAFLFALMGGALLIMTNNFGPPKRVSSQRNSRL